MYKHFLWRIDFHSVIRWIIFVKVVSFPAVRIEAGILASFSGNHRSVAEDNPSVDGTFNFAVFRQDGIVASDVFGTGRVNFDDTFIQSEGATDFFDTSARYLYLYQAVNDGPGFFQDTTQYIINTPQITSWGHWEWGLHDAEGFVKRNNPFGLNVPSFLPGAPANLGVSDGFVADTRVIVGDRPVDKEPLSITLSDGSLTTRINLQPGETSTIFGFTSDAPPVLRNIRACAAQLCGDYVTSSREPERFFSVDPQATYLRAASEGALCNSHTDTSLGCQSSGHAEEPPTVGPSPAKTIDLSTAIIDRPVQAGDWLLLQRVGDFRASQAPCALAGTCDNFSLVHPDRPSTLRNMFGVFSSNDTLRSDPEAIRGQKQTPIPMCIGDCVDTNPEDGVPDNLNSDFTRVPGAISVTEGNALPFNTDTTRFEEGIIGDPFNNLTMVQLTDIAEDFVINLGKSTGGSIEHPEPVLVRVPEGATHLFVSAGDGQYFDNTLTDSTDLPNGPDGSIVGVYGLNIAVVEPGRLLGDYNLDGLVDAADYTVWRDHQGEVGLLLAADGNANGRVDVGDYEVWRSHFGLVIDSGTLQANSVPVPSSIVLMFLAGLALHSYGRNSIRCGDSIRLPLFCNK